MRDAETEIHMLR